MNRLKLYLIFLVIHTSWVVAAAQSRSNVKINIDLDQEVQTMANFGASGCWFSENIGKYWPTVKKDKIAQLLFSQQMDKMGQPQGIGLSAWRFNIGAGTLEQGDSSGIKDFRRRADCFLSPDGSYDWTKQQGQQFFLQKAKDYGVNTLIAFANSPPVQFTKNGLGYKTEKDYITNLKEEAYSSYAHFLTNVAKHFKDKGLPFDYISPVNEPQWDWFKKYKEADQEGSPWTNAEIYKITKALNAELDQAHLSSKILISEAATLNYLYGGKGNATHQIQTFFNSKSPLQLNELAHVPKIIAGHSYFTESNDSVLYTTRKNLSDTMEKYQVNFWQSEYSMLGDGFKEGFTTARTAMDCALFLSKVIHTDLTVANASAWQFWNAYEPGNPLQNTRYYLIALQGGTDFKDGDFQATKNLWALGHYSRFIRPGMKRITAQAATPGKDKLLVTAFKNENKQIVVVITNTSTNDIKFDLDLAPTTKKYHLRVYQTSAEEGMDMKFLANQKTYKNSLIKARSIQTLLLE